MKKGFMYFCLAALLSSCGQTKEKKDETPLSVKVSQATSLSAESNREFTFISKPFKTTDLSFRVGGPIDRFEVYEGNYYKRGDIIAEIDSRDFRIRKERVEAVYTQAKAEYERIKILYEKNNLSASAYEKARAEYTSAKTAFETATNELDDTRLIAPFNGYVGEVYMEKYQDVKATQPVLSFIDIDQLRVEAYVTQDIAFGLQQKFGNGQQKPGSGQQNPDSSQKLSEVSLYFDANPDTPYRARITEISKSTTRNNLSYLLTALLPNPQGKLLGGMSGKVSFHVPVTESKTMITVPQTALCHRPTVGDYVYVIDQQTQKAEQRMVTVGNLLPQNRISIVDGLKENEMVAVSGLRFLSDGITVTIAQEAQARPATAKK